MAHLSPLQASLQAAIKLSTELHFPPHNTQQSCFLFPLGRERKRGLFWGFAQVCRKIALASGVQHLQAGQQVANMPSPGPAGSPQSTP